MMKLRVVILCAGYGSRLQKELENNNTNSYFHLIGIPKPLLPINHKPLIEHWFNLLENVSSVSEIILITNDIHKNLYKEFINQLGKFKKPLKIISDGSISNDSRSGAVVCMQLGVKDGNYDSFIIAGDTLFDKSFVIEEMIDAFLKLKMISPNACLITSAPVSEENVSKHGIIEVDDKGQVKKFLEKPQLHETSSRLQSPCCYLLSKNAISLIDEFLQARADKPLSTRDATGHFIQYLVTKAPVFEFRVKKRFDIGNLASYIDCCRNYV